MVLADLPIIEGELWTDDLSLALFATDASMYQKKPHAVVSPKSEDDIRKIMSYAFLHKLAILPRGSGTSLAGQTVNKAIVIDYTKYFNKILSINEREGWAIVQPGVVRDQLNTAVSKYGLHFGPDPATSSRASFGGMIANNSSGTKSILYGKTSDHVIALKIMTATGNVFTLQTKSPEEYDLIAKMDTEEGHIYREFRSLIYTNTEEIIATYPKVMRRVGGYALDAFVDKSDWNLCEIIIGSEGTLVQILEAKINLVPLPKYNNMVIIHYNNRLKGIANAKDIVPFGPAAVELLDYNVIQLSKTNILTKKYCDNTIIGDPQAVLTVEFYGQTQEEIDVKAEALCIMLQNYPSAYAFPVTNDQSIINDALALRKEGLGLIMGKTGMNKNIPFIEDAALPLEYLADYINEVEDFCRSVDSEVVLYAHASVGVLHVRPSIDLTKQSDIDKMKLISDHCFHLVKKYKGSWSGEHGDGRVRGPQVNAFYGEQIYKALKAVKKIFDPHGLLNPNIIVDTEDMRSHLRYHDNYIDQQYPFVYKYRGGTSFQEMVHNCSGVGACRNTEKGTMCPSYRATGEEVDTTRGRANVLRLAMSGQMHFDDLAHSDVKKVMALCLSCKACKTECPSNVDLSKLKAEVLQINFAKHGASLSEKMPKYASAISKALSGWPAHFVNPALKWKMTKAINQKLFGVTPKRNLPAYATTTLTQWCKQYNNFKSKNKVVLFADTYINYHEVDLGKDAILLLNKCGYEVILADIGCCQRPKISNGFLSDAKTELEPLALKLLNYIDQGLSILTVEPSCTTALIDDLPDLIDNGEIGKRIKANVLPAETFLINLAKSSEVSIKFKLKENQYVHHGHCHQKAVYSTKSVNQLLTLAGGQGAELNTGCCGMAGAFGYEDHHYDLSVRMANDRLIPQLNSQPQRAIVANGYSCRHQIADLTGRKAIHILSILDVVQLI